MLKIGMGYDLHRLVEDRKLILGGVDIPFVKGLAGHSDGDVLIHAIIDAILGACTLGDIGHHFPDDDPQYEGVASVDLLARIQQKIVQMGRIEHIDTTIVAQRPELASHITTMRETVSDVLKVPIDKVSIKAKTAEGVDAVGRGEAIEAYAVALVDL